MKEKGISKTIKAAVIVVIVVVAGIGAYFMLKGPGGAPPGGGEGEPAPAPQPTVISIPTELAPAGCIRPPAGYDVSAIYPAPLAEAPDMTFNPSGDLLVIEMALPRIRRVTPDGEVSTYATLPHPFWAIAYNAEGELFVGGGDGIHKVLEDGTLTTFCTTGFTGVVLKMVLGPNGAFYTIERDSPEVKKVTPDGKVSTYVTGLSCPEDLAFSPTGELYVSDPSSRSILKVNGDGTLTTVATGFWMDPGAIAFDGEGHLFYWGFWEGEEGWVGMGMFEVSVSDGSVTPLAIGIHPGACHDLEVDDSGNIFGIGPTLSIIFKVSPEGEVEYLTEGWYNNRGMAVGPSGDLFIADRSQSPRRPGRIIRAGMDGSHSVFSDNLYYPRGLTFDASGNLFVSDENKLVKITPQGEMHVVAEELSQMSIAFDGVSGDIFGFECLSFQGQPAKLLRITPEGNVSAVPVVFDRDIESGNLAVDAEGNILLAVTYAENIGIGPLSTELLKISPEGEVTVLAELTDDTTEWTHNLAIAPSGDIYLVDQPGRSGAPSAFVMWKITPQGDISLFATHIPSDPFSIAINPEGDIFFTSGIGIYRIFAVKEGMVIDGLKDDWQEYPPVIVDPQGDWEDLETDMKALYGFTDDKNMYLMVEFYQFSDAGLDSLNVEIDLDGDGWTDYTCVFIPNAAIVLVYDEDEPSWSWQRRGLLYIDGVAEIKMPLCYIGGARDFYVTMVAIGETNGTYYPVDRIDWARVTEK